jgi:hypothetical protein
MMKIQADGGFLTAWKGTGGRAGPAGLRLRMNDR